MNKELFVSSTPHETKVGLVEDDQLAEIYLERENEYTLAGSIYKGRVTRVLPGMQSAFVDIGLERDAFLYVSDFMELEDSEDARRSFPPTGRAPERYPRKARSRSARWTRRLSLPHDRPKREPQEASEVAERAESVSPPASGESREDRGGMARTPSPPGTPGGAHAGNEVCPARSGAQREAPRAVGRTARTP